MLISVKNILVFAILLMPIQVYSQRFKLGCGLDKVIDPTELEGTISPIVSGDILQTYLNDIQRRVFGMRYRNNIKIQRTSKPKVAGAYMDTDGREANYDRVITINNASFEESFSNSEEKKAVDIFIIAHEYAHHERGDVFRLKNGLFANFEHEILADERGGYAVGKLTTDIDDTFFDKALLTILENEKFSGTHPGKYYRILAAKAGFALAKLENHESGFKTNINGRVYEYIAYSNAEAYIINNNLRYNIYSDETFIIGYFDNDSNTWSGTAIKYQNGEDLGNSMKSRQLFFGTYKNSLINGKGYVIWVNNLSYLGDYVNGMRNGEGTEVHNNGVYKGSYTADKEHGSGIYEWNSGSVYKGRWISGQKAGYGTYKWDNGDIYIGNWKSDNKHGKGKFTYSNGVVKEGCWNNDNFVGNNCPD